MAVNHLKLSKNGECLVDKEQLRSAIIEEFKSGNIRHSLFPMISIHGIRDYSETVHSAGLNYITEIGRYIQGITALSECPIYPTNQQYGHSVTREVRPDSVWYRQADVKPVLVSEFERFGNSKAKHDKLREKIENLLLAYHQLGSDLPLILFVYWSYSGSIPKDIDKYIRIFDEGFTLPNGRFIPGIDSFVTDYLIFQAVASGTKENLTINEWIQVR
jgi:hypothetical protein